MAAVEVVRAAPVEPPIEEVVLRLTPEEAVAVGAVFGHTTGPERPFYNIYEALVHAGFGFAHVDYDRLWKASGLTNVVGS